MVSTSNREPVPGPLAALLSRRVTGPAIDQFLRDHDVPLQEGRSCIFLYRGEADSVRLRHWIHGLPSSQPLRRLRGTDLWHIALELPEGSRVEYKYEVTRHGHTELIKDPLNPLEAHDPFGANSVAHARGYEIPEWTRPDETARRGSLEELVVKSRALGGDRAVTIYKPARYRTSRRYPLLVVHDGPDYLRYAGLETVLNNLIHRLEIQGMVVALTRPQNRMQEYTAHRPHAEFIAKELVPRLERELPLREGPRARGLMGASLGAVASLHAAHEYPELFGRLLLQSGSFAFTDIGDARTRSSHSIGVVEFVNEFRREPQHAISLDGSSFELRRCTNPSSTRTGLWYRLLHATGMRRPLHVEVPGTDTTGRTGATACERACRFCFPGHCGWSTSRGVSLAMPDVIRRIGLSLGADICWPICYQELMRRLEPIQVPHDDGTPSLRSGASVHRALRPSSTLSLRRGHRSAHTLVSTRPASGSKSRSYIDDLYVFNNPWSRPVHGETNHVLCHDSTGHADSRRRVMVPPKEYEPRRTICR